MSGKLWVIVGGGISGLSLLWYLKRYRPEQKVVLLEKTARAGGVIYSSCKEGMSLQEGPKTFRMAEGEALLEMIVHVGLSDKLLIADKQERFIYYQKALRRLPSGPWGLATTTLGRKLLKGIWQDMRRPSEGDEEESVASFMRRRFGDEVTRALVEPFILGTSGGDIETMSIKVWKELQLWEKDYGSVIKGFLRKKPQDSRLFNLEGGAFTLVKTLAQQLQEAIVYEQGINKIEPKGKELVLHTASDQWLVEKVFLTLPLVQMKTVAFPEALEKDPFIKEACAASFVGLHLWYKKNVLPVKGFGFLAPSCENVPILGAIFDGEIFPSHGNLLTVMMGGMRQGQVVEASNEELVRQGLEGLRKCLKIEDSPQGVHLVRYKEALPQYPVGYFSRLEAFQKKLAKYP
ncbi:MAG: protoporphyrinogen oxidase, partial [Chlamydiae bacterium]|nr:protoporphyrinogen oxidase [Chlamydiota bacterium]